MGCWEEIPCEGGEVPRAAVAAPGSLEGSKARLDRAWSSLGWWEASLPMAGGGTREALRFLTTQTFLGFWHFMESSDFSHLSSRPHSEQCGRQELGRTQDWEALV